MTKFFSPMKSLYNKEYLYFIGLPMYINKLNYVCQKTYILAAIFIIDGNFESAQNIRMIYQNVECV